MDLFSRVAMYLVHTYQMGNLPTYQKLNLPTYHECLLPTYLTTQTVGAQWSELGGHEWESISSGRSARSWLGSWELWFLYLAFSAFSLLSGRLCSIILVFLLCTSASCCFLFLLCLLLLWDSVIFLPLENRASPLLSIFYTSQKFADLCVRWIFTLGEES